MTTPSHPRDPAADDTVVRAAWPSEPAPARKPTRRARLVAALGALVIILLGGLYLVGYLLAGDRLPQNAVVAGVAVGGLDRADAIAQLTDQLGPRAGRPIPVEVSGQRHDLDPTEAGLGVDYEASIARAGGGRSLDPRQIWRVLTGGASTDAVVTSDGARLEAAVAALAAKVDQKPKNAGLRYEGTDVRLTKATAGVTLDRERAADALRTAYLGSDRAVELPAAVAEPEITTAEVTTVAKEFAEPAVAAPVVVRAEGAGRFRVTPAMIAASVEFAAADGTLAPKLDPERLRAEADDAVAKVELKKPKDATVRLRDGKPVVVPAVNGTELTAAELARAVEPVLANKGKAARTVGVTLTGDEAEFSTADAEALGIKRVTGEFTTYFPYANYRNVNIGRAAELINGTVLKPGDTFSLNKVVGERTAANGFTKGFIISGSRFREELGGGVSQSATTTFNAMFFAGLKDIQHRPHELYIDRYPAGREATVAWPTLDLKFENDTKYGVLVQAFVQKSTPSSKGSITVRMWSTKTWDKVRSSELRRSDFTSGRTITDDGPKCVPQEPVQGFTVNYARLFYRDGEIVRREPFSWRYGPTDKVTCT